MVDELPVDMSSWWAWWAHWHYQMQILAAVPKKRAPFNILGRLVNRYKIHGQNETLYQWLEM